MIKLVAFLSHVSSLGGVYYYLRYRNKLNDHRFVTLLLFIVSVLTFTSDSIVFFHIVNNYVVVNTCFFIQFMLVGVVYYTILPNRYKLVNTVLTLGSVAFLVNSIFGQPITGFQHISWSLYCILALVLCATDLFVERKKPGTLLTQEPTWWVSSGVMFYNGFSVFFFLFLPWLLELLQDNIQYVWLFHNVNNIYKNLAFAGAIYWYVHKPLNPIKRK